MRKILVPVDGSDNASRALRFAIGLAKEHAVELHVLNVQEPIEIRVHAYLQKDRIDAVLAEEAESVLQSARDALAQSGVRYTAAWRIGDVAPTIDRDARENGCDVIVMGTRGMSALGNLVLGSVANKVLHLTAMPLTLVK